MTLGHGMRGSDGARGDGVAGRGDGDEKGIGASQRQFVFFRYKSWTAKVFRA